MHPLKICFAPRSLILPPSDQGFLPTELVEFLLLSAHLPVILLYALVNPGNIFLEHTFFLLEISARTHFSRLLIAMLVQRLMKAGLLPYKPFMLLCERGELIFPPLRVKLPKLRRLFRL